MAEEFLLVSCDIVGYSAEPDIALQLQRAQAVNDMIRPAVAAAGSDQGFWFSGGDGGHVAFTGATAPGKALQLLLDLRTWSITSQVPLRIAGCVGLGERFTGADGRVDMVGPGVNLAARLLQYAGSDLRIVVTDAFRGRCNGLTSVAATFHEPRVVRGPFPHPQQVWLVSGPGQSPSKWAPPFGLAPDAEQDDRADLRRAVARADGLAVLYRAKRLLQVNSSDAEALQALRDSMGPAASHLGSSRMLRQLLAEPDLGQEFIRAAVLVERKEGQLLCSAGDEGRTMLLMVRGRLAGFLPHGAEAEPRQPDFEISGLRDVTATHLARNCSRFQRRRAVQHRIVRASGN